jgi:hypothetical protein
LSLSDPPFDMRLLIWAPERRRTEHFCMSCTRMLV